MKLDVLGLLGACSYALDCVEAELVHVTSRHAKRVAYMSVCTAETLGVDRKSTRLNSSHTRPSRMPSSA